MSCRSRQDDSRWGDPVLDLSNCRIKPFYRDLLYCGTFSPDEQGTHGSFWIDARQNVPIDRELFHIVPWRVRGPPGLEIGEPHCVIGYRKAIDASDNLAGTIARNLREDVHFRAAPRPE